METMEYKGYKGTVEFSQQDNCYFGKVSGMSEDLITYEGENKEELRRDFEQGVDSYLEGCREEGIPPRKPYNGKMVICLSPDEHSRIAALAHKAGKSVSAFVRQALALL